MSDRPIDDESAGEQDNGQEEVIRLSVRDSRAVIEAVQHPPEAGSTLKRAAERYQNLVGEQ